MKYSEMTLREIAIEVRNDWKNMSPHAVPYLKAMYNMRQKDATGTYGDDSVKSIILYFLSNATTWRGQVAREIKSHLKSLIK